MKQGRERRHAWWISQLAAASVALALAAAGCGRDVELGVAPTADAAPSDAADAGASQ
jgi:hypothetical protein